MTEALGHHVAAVEKIQGTAQPLSPRELCGSFYAHCALELQRQNSAQRDEAQRPGCTQTKGRLLAPIRGPAAAAAARRVLVRPSIARRVWVLIPASCVFSGSVWAVYHENHSKYELMVTWKTLMMDDSKTIRLRRGHNRCSHEVDLHRQNKEMFTKAHL